jgi:cytochrome c oxidase subunit 4
MGQHHVIPLSTYLKVAGALFALTILTIVGHIYLHGTILSGPVAFLIAAVKAALVLLYFMHLKYDNMLNRVIFGSGLFFLILLIAFSALDIWTRVTANSTL